MKSIKSQLIVEWAYFQRIQVYKFCLYWNAAVGYVLILYDANYKMLHILLHIITAISSKNVNENHDVEENKKFLLNLLREVYSLYRPASAATNCAGQSITFKCRNNLDNTCDQAFIGHC